MLDVRRRTFGYTSTKVRKEDYMLYRPVEHADLSNLFQGKRG